MLNLGLIQDDRNIGVLCETLAQFEVLIESIKTQRQDIDCELHLEKTASNYANKVYYLNYHNSGVLQMGNPDKVHTLGLSYCRFEELWIDDLPDISVNEAGVFHLLGVK